MTEEQHLSASVSICLIYLLLSVVCVQPRRRHLLSQIGTRQSAKSISARSAWHTEIHQRYASASSWQFVRSSLVKGVCDIEAKAPGAANDSEQADAEASTGADAEGDAADGASGDAGAEADADGDGEAAEEQEQDDEDPSVCCICFDGESTELNPIVYCENCNISVHKCCYGISKIPEDDWFCDYCINTNEDLRKGKKGNIKAQPFPKNSLGSSLYPCALCTVQEGALKPTDNGVWAHIMCSLWVPNVRMGDVTSMSLVEGVEEALTAHKQQVTTSSFPPSPLFFLFLSL